jgi:hypothetical protein|tara:strand:+ start:23409 stop:23957 length:549 start_codon:yes stop_codon:yes gene_type:complete
MADTYASDNWINVVEEHATHALQADGDLGTSGALEIQTWDEELREDAAQYTDQQLPAIVVNCQSMVPDFDAEEEGVPDGISITFPIQVWWIGTAADRQRRVLKAKESLARIVRVLMQQHLTSKQLQLSTGEKLPASLEWGVGGSVTVRVTGADFDDGEVSSQFRAVGLVEADITISFTITGD